MKGLLGYEVYIPHYRIAKKEIGTFHKGYGGKGTKAVAHYDEDSLTMAVNAAMSLSNLLSKHVPSSLYFASTTAPYAEKLASVTMAKTLHLPTDTKTMDFGNSLRAASNAFMAGMNSVEAEKKPVLLSMADRRNAKPNNPVEAEMGAGAVSFLLGEGEEVIAELVASSTVASEEVSQWRNTDDEFVRQWEDRFIAHVSTKSVFQCAKQVLEKTKTTLEEIDYVIVSGASQKLSLSIAKALQVKQEKWAAMMDEDIGHIGTANGPFMVAKTLSNSQPNETILWLQVGDGCDGVLLKTTENIVHHQNERRQPVGKGNELISYSEYLRWYDLLTVDEGRRPSAPTPSAPALNRNVEQNLGLFGSKCTQCGQSYYPKQRVCVKCHQKDEMESFSLQGKKAKIATYTVDYLASSVSPPSIFAVIDMEGGSRMLAQVTDCGPTDISIGTEVAFSFRKLYDAGGIHNYYWKVVPKRGVQHES
ncbi:OB-fold domain-containing protein [Bacillus spongiae]|uniref:OB-fold domain-containing protein n=2 Tax=Bacillus spongiae TaxID=2683610 RepID=A0ABU8HIE9_9BACI